MFPRWLHRFIMSPQKTVPMPPAVGLRDALAQLFLLLRVESIEVDAVQPAFLDDLAQYLLFEVLPVRRAEQ